MNSALGFCDKDAVAAANLFRWMAEMDGKISASKHSVVLIASNNMKRERMDLVKREAENAFESVQMVMPSIGNEEGWPISSNHLFLTSLKFFTKNKSNYFYWFEPDCVPLKIGWLDALEAEYIKAGKPFMGCVYERPWPHLTGCAVYPVNLSKYSPNVLHPGKMAWDMVDTKTTIENAHHTELYQHEWGNFKYNIPPSFPTQASLKFLRNDAVIFHRCKDGSLIERLRERKRHPAICATLRLFGTQSNVFQDYDDCVP